MKNIALCLFLFELFLFPVYPQIKHLEESRIIPQFDEKLHKGAMIFAGKRMLPGAITALDTTLAPFYHGVASGDPLQDRVIIWTRLTSDVDGPVPVQWFVSTDTSFTTITSKGTVIATPDKDNCVKVDVEGLEPDKTYYYVFLYNGKYSLIGRTKTLAQTSEHLKVAFISCSNYTTGFFNVYANLAKRNDLDVALHLGDYIYEYGTSTFNSLAAMKTGRFHEPRDSNDVYTIATYRARYSQYRLDEDLRRFHQQHPVIHVWDDHESVNNSYKDGAQSHNTTRYGDWHTRKNAAKKVCLEWLPTRESADSGIYRSFVYGSIAEILMLDTRLEGRDAQISGVGPTMSVGKRDSLFDPQRTILGAKQRDWLLNKLQQSKSRWKIIGNQVMFTPMSIDSINRSILQAEAPIIELFLPSLLPSIQSAFYGDTWANYPAERSKIFEFIRTNSINNVIFATGDFHTSFAFDVTLTPTNTATYNPTTGFGSAAVEFMCPSITMSNYDEILSPEALSSLFRQQTVFQLPDSTITVLSNTAASPLLRTLETSLPPINPHLKFADVVHHGYNILDITPQRVQNDYWFVDTILIKSSKEYVAASFIVEDKKPFLQKVSNPAPAKTQQATASPLNPPKSLTTSVRNVHQAVHQPMTILALYPQPAQSLAYLQYHLAKPEVITISVVDLSGRIVRVLMKATPQNGLQTLVFTTEDLESGTYFLQMETTSLVLRKKIGIIR